MEVYDDQHLPVTWLEEEMFDVAEEQVCAISRSYPRLIHKEEKGERTNFLTQRRLIPQTI